MLMAAPARPATTLRHASRLSAHALATVFMAVFAVYFLLPIVWLVLAATKSNADLFTTPGLWVAPTFRLGDNLHALFTSSDGEFTLWCANTVLYAGASALGSTALATLVGYALAKFSFRGREVLFALILGSIMVPSTALVLPTYLLMSKLHLVNSYWGIILPQLVNPFGVYLMRVYSSQAVPNDLLDAARIDGAGELRAFWSVAVRVLMPGIVTVLLFAFVGAWNNYFLPLVVLSDEKLYPLTVGLALLQGRMANNPSELNYSLVMTGAVVTLVPLIIAFLVLRRYWRTGLLLGSLAGG